MFTGVDMYINVNYRTDCELKVQGCFFKTRLYVKCNRHLHFQ